MTILRIAIKHTAKKSSQVFALKSKHVLFRLALKVTKSSLCQSNFPK